MHASVMQWVGSLVQELKLESKDTLEVGSLDENGSVRDFFNGTYTGVDMRPGPGVDKVAHAHDLPWGDGAFDTVISTEMLEHDKWFWLSLSEMGRVLKPEGTMILTARGNGFPLHSYPNDYWRFMLDSGPELLALAGCAVVLCFADPEQPGIFMHGQKKPELSRTPPACDCGQVEGEKHKHTCSYGRWLLVHSLEWVKESVSEP